MEVKAKCWFITLVVLLCCSYSMTQGKRVILFSVNLFAELYANLTFGKMFYSATKWLSGSPGRIVFQILSGRDWRYDMVSEQRYMCDCNKQLDYNKKCSRAQPCTSVNSKQQRFLLDWIE